MKRIAWLVVLVAGFVESSACAAAGPGTLSGLQVAEPDSGTPALFLAREVTLDVIEDDAVTLPAGRYVPIGRTDKGVYYRAESPVTFASARPAAGGLFIPSVASEPQHLWLERYAVAYDANKERLREAQSRSSGALGSSSPLGIAAALAAQSDVNVLEKAGPDMQVRAIRHPYYVLRTKVPLQPTRP
jgi:hypothetical protein